MTPLDSIWPIQRWFDSYNRLHSYVNYESAGWHFVHTCAGWRKRRAWKCCAIVGSELLRLYVQILVLLVDGKHYWWSEGSIVRGVIRVPVVTSAGVKGWKLPRTGWRSITVDGCGVLCVLLRLYLYSFQQIWQGSVWTWHLGSLTAANWVSFDFNVAYSSRWGYSLINTFKFKKKIWRSCQAQGRGQAERKKFSEKICQVNERNLAAGPRELAKSNNGCANW